jgi:hypothetical protein
MNQFASISTDGQVLLWEKKFIDAHKKPVTDVIFYLFSLLIINGKLTMDSICLGLKEEEQWAEHLSVLIRTKNELYSLVHQIKDSYLFAIGLQEALMRQVVKMIL